MKLTYHFSWSHCLMYTEYVADSAWFRTQSHRWAKSATFIVCCLCKKRR